LRLEEPDDTTKSTLMNEDSCNAVSAYAAFDQLRNRPKLPKLDDLGVSVILSKPSLRDRFSNNGLSD